MAITTQDELNQGDEAFSAAFAEPEAERQEISEDQAFGLEPEGVSEDGTQDATGGEPPAETVDVASGPTPGELEAATQSQTVEVDPAAESDVVDPKDEQRQKSWEGRLRAREAELKAREDALRVLESGGEPLEPGETPAQEAAEPAVTEALEDAAEKVESGEMTVDQALKTLSADFGEDFTKMLGVLIGAKAAESAGKVVEERVGKVSQTVDEVLSSMVDDKARAHFEAIADAHPDFMDVADGEPLKNYLASLDSAARAHAERVIEGGSAKEIIKVLDAVKAAASEDQEQDPDPEQQEVMDAAEGVRSRGMKLPEKPAASSDYEGAWNDFD